jgi:hypothetical protein
VSNLFFDLLKVLSKDDKLVLAAQTADGIKAVAQGVAAFSKKGGKLEKGANLAAIVFGSAADAAQVELLGGTATEKNVGRFLTGLSALGQSGSVVLGSDGSLRKLAGCTAAAGKLGSALYITRQVEKLAEPAALLPEKSPLELEPTTIDVTAEHVGDATTAPAVPPKVIARGRRSKKAALQAAQTAAAIAEVCAALSKDESATQNVLEAASTAGDSVARAIIGKRLAESDSEYKLALGANAVETAGTILDIFASEDGTLKVVAGLSKAAGGGATRIARTRKLGALKKKALAQSPHSQRTPRRLPVRKLAILPPEGAPE